MKKFIVLSVFLCTGVLFAEVNSFLILDLKTESILGSISKGKFYKSKDTYGKLKQSMPEFVKVNSFGTKRTYLKLADSILNDTFDVYDDTHIKEKEIQLKTLEKTDFYCPNYFQMTTSSKVNSGVAISNSINWNLTPREIKPLAKNSKVYNAVVKDILISKGFKNPKISIKQIYSTDLDNDKQNEIIIVGEHYKNIMKEGGARRSSSNPGDYSFVIVRNVYKGKVNNIFLGESFNVSSIDSAESRVVPNTYELTAILDLNGDGTMELIVYSYYYEGGFTSVYQFRKGGVISVLGAGCGS